MGKHLIESLVAKIKVLKLLTQKQKVNKDALIRTVTRLLGQAAVTKIFLEFIGMTPTEYKKINPDAEMFKNDKNESNKGSPTISNTLVMTSRVKPIEEPSNE